MEKAVAEYPEKPSLYGKSSVSLGDLSQSGVYGDPTKATEEKGKLMLDAFVKTISDEVREAFTMTQEKKPSR
jgi:creatinine amidohydrolase